MTLHEPCGREQVQHQSLEDLIMANLPTKGGREVTSVIYNCWSDDSINPWNDVVQAAAQAVSGLSQDCTKLATLAGAFDEFARQWQHFQTNEPVLYKALLDECERGIVARTQGGSVGKATSTGRDSGRDIGEVLVAGAAVDIGLALADSDGNSGGNIGADSGGSSHGFFDFLSDFFDFLSDFFDGLHDFFDGLGDFLGDCD